MIPKRHTARVQTLGCLSINFSYDINSTTCQWWMNEQLHANHMRTNLRQTTCRKNRFNKYGNISGTIDTI